VYFELVSEISGVSVLVQGPGVRRQRELREEYGGGRWRKLKGTGFVRLSDGTLARAELHWYEAHGIGRRRMKIKRFLE
jgi:hypothetical protein